MGNLPSWARYVFDLAAAQGVFLSFFLLTSRRNHRANLLLSTLAFAMAVGIFVPRWLFSVLQGLPPHTVNFLDISPYLFGPLLYLYVRQLTRQGFRWSRHWLHFLPFLVMLKVLIPFYMIPPQQKHDAIASLLVNPVDVKLAYLLVATQFGHTLIYTVLSLRCLKSFNQRLQAQFSNLDKVNLIWLTSLCWGFASLLCLIMLLSLLSFSGIDFRFPLNLYYSLGLATFLYLIAFFALRQQQILFPNPEKEKYRAASLSAMDLDRHIEPLLALMKEEKPYLENELSLSDLATRAKIPEHHLSQLLNDRLKQNFYGFINRYRLEEACALLSDPEKNHLTILAIAFQAGFNNKVSFNKVFKEREKCTPSAFRRRQCGRNST